MKIENFIEFFALISCHNKDEDKLITKITKNKKDGKMNEKDEYLLNLESHYLAKQIINGESGN